MIVHFILERETKGAVRYAETASADSTTKVDIREGAKIGTLYIRKTAFNGLIPTRLEVKAEGY